MRKLVTLLATTTAIFGASTLYLAYQLYGRNASAGNEAVTTPAATVDSRDRASETATPGELPAGGGARPAVTNTPTPAAPGVVASAAPARPSAEPVGSRRETIAPFARQFLARVSDPAQRAILVEESRSSLRRQYEGLQKRLNLDAATFDQLLTELAEQNLQPQEAYFRCVVDPKCDLDAYQRRPNSAEDRNAQLLALLGPEKLEQFTDYRDSLGERESVVQLRGRLNESTRLRDDQAEQLVAALSDERSRYVDELSQRGASVSGWGTGQLGMLMYPTDSGSIDQRLSDAAHFSQRLQGRAAALLSPEQLAVFVQMQKELLASMATYMRPAPGEN